MNLNIETLIIGIMTGIIAEYFSLSFAYFEYQIEGDKSWARSLPCWRRKYSWFSKEITGYHVSLFSLFVGTILLTIMTIYITSILANIKIIVDINFFILIIGVLISILILGVMHEDFLWNVVNPSDKFGVKDFTKKFPEIGKTIFIWFIPIEYIIMTVLSFFVAYFIGETMILFWLIIYFTMLLITLFLATKRYMLDIKNRNRKY